MYLCIVNAKKKILIKIAGVENWFNVCETNFRS